MSSSEMLLFLLKPVTWTLHDIRRSELAPGHGLRPIYYDGTLDSTSDGTQKSCVHSSPPFLYPTTSASLALTITDVSLNPTLLLFEISWLIG
ncbi:unnamed protein product [Arctia plantaginis]|uniref:Uncharacterized protein n=1 Tax=Arctia plantaginis TaxID=874455 RepID=A0A8S1A929_ARCPL|nr:unnamed protein product [Arctia plantaginis]